MANKQLFKTQSGRLPPATDTLNEAGGKAYALSPKAALAQYTEFFATAVVVVCITYVSLIIGELVPKRLALIFPETVASKMAKPISAYDDPAALRQQSAGGILFQPVTQLAISATQIRALLAHGQSPRYLLPDPVLAFIHDRALYRPLPAKTPVPA